LELLGKPRSLIEYVRDRPGHDLRYAIDCSKAEREPGWKPEVDFRQGIRDNIDWSLGPCGMGSPCALRRLSQVL